MKRKKRMTVFAEEKVSVWSNYLDKYPESQVAPYLKKAIRILKNSV